MQLREFEKAEEVQKLMNKCEFQQMGLLNDRYESYCLFEQNQLKDQQAKELSNMKQRQQNERKQFDKQANLRIFETVQNMKNAKFDMDHAHKLEFINFNHKQVDRDIVNDKRNCVDQATLRGSQKLKEALQLQYAQQK